MFLPTSAIANCAFLVEALEIKLSHLSINLIDAVIKCNCLPKYYQWCDNTSFLQNSVFLLNVTADMKYSPEVFSTADCCVLLKQDSIRNLHSCHYVFLQNNLWQFFQSYFPRVEKTQNSNEERGVIKIKHRQISMLSRLEERKKTATHRSDPVPTQLDHFPLPSLWLLPAVSGQRVTTAPLCAKKTIKLCFGI